MDIWFYTPFKPLGHPHPSGDLAIASGLHAYLCRRGHRLQQPSALRSRWLYWQPWKWPLLARDHRRAVRCGRRHPAGLWLTYHSYYKAPDLLGPWTAARMAVPYCVFQGVYATKRRRSLRTWPGFVLNRAALLRARHVFTNKRVDLVNLRRLLAEDRITYVAPGIDPDAFANDPAARARLRGRWAVGATPVVLAAAMLRPGVKSMGVEVVIRACGRLRRRGHELFLVVVGDGPQKGRLRQVAARELPGRALFAGRVDRRRIGGYYSAADVFAFPGIRESLGMVYLEAQACGLPVVAYRNAGVPEVVRDGQTALLAPPGDTEGFARAVATLLRDAERRRAMGAAACQHVRSRHDIMKNYGVVESVLVNTARAWRRRREDPRE